MGQEEHNKNGHAPEFPAAKFELLVRSFLDKLIEWEVMHKFAMAHFDDAYPPEFQRPIEDLHLMFFPKVTHDHELHNTRPQMKYLLDVWDLLKQDVQDLGVENIRERELQRMASEAAGKTESRRAFREQHRPQD